MRAGVGGRWYHAPMQLGSGEVKLVVVLGFKSGIQTVTISAVGECAKSKLSVCSEIWRLRRWRAVKSHAYGEDAELTTFLINFTILFSYCA
jgi:hypothetical protein